MKNHNEQTTFLSKSEERDPSKFCVDPTEKPCRSWDILEELSYFVGSNIVTKSQSTVIFIG